MASPSVTVSLTPAESLVLFEWLNRWQDSRQFSIVHPSEERVLWDLTAQLERQLVDPFQADYAALLSAARDTVAKGH